jgi:hypothetical protein
VLLKAGTEMYTSLKEMFALQDGQVIQRSPALMLELMRLRMRQS